MSEKFSSGAKYKQTNQSGEGYASNHDWVAGSVLAPVLLFISLVKFYELIFFRKYYSF